jgi:hypothetical protein
MSTIAEYTAAAKAYANAVRTTAVRVVQYDTAHTNLEAAKVDEEVKRQTLKTVAEGLAQDIP